MHDAIVTASLREDPGALRGGITIERRAEVSAHIDHFSEHDLPAVVARFGLGTEAWMIAADAWNDAIMEDKSSKLSRAYARTYESVRERLKREAPALDAVGTAPPGFELEGHCFAGVKLRRYAEVLAHIQHFGTGHSAEVVARFGLTPKQWNNASQAWLTAVAQGAEHGVLWISMETDLIADKVRERLQKESPDISAVGSPPPAPGPSADSGPPPAPSSAFPPSPSSPPSSPDPSSVPPPSPRLSTCPPPPPDPPAVPPARLVPAPKPSVWSRFIAWLAGLFGL